MDKTQYRKHFHLSGEHIYELKGALNTPDKVVISQRTVATGIGALCILLER